MERQFHLIDGKEVSIFLSLLTEHTGMALLRVELWLSTRQSLSLVGHTGMWSLRVLPGLDLWGLWPTQVHIQVLGQWQFETPPELQRSYGQPVPVSGGAVNINKHIDSVMPTLILYQDVLKGSLVKLVFLLIYGTRMTEFFVVLAPSLCG